MLTCSFAGKGVKGDVRVVDNDEVAGHQEHASHITEPTDSVESHKYANYIIFYLDVNMALKGL